MKLPKLIATVDTLNMKPRDYECEPVNGDGNGLLYFWKLSNIWRVFPELQPRVQGDYVIVKIGYAKEYRIIGRNQYGRRYGVGALHRARECIMAWEKCFGIDKGVISARVYAIAVGTANEMLAAAQYLHRRNQKTGIHFLPSIEALSGKYGSDGLPAGKTEFYLSTIQSLYGKFLNCQRRSNKQSGWSDIKDANFRGPSGWKLPTVGVDL